MYFTVCHDNTICILKYHRASEIFIDICFIWTDLQKSWNCSTVQTCFLTDWFDCDRALSWDEKAGGALINKLYIYLRYKEYLGNAQLDWSIYSRYNCISWHYVFYFFGPGIYKTKPLTLQSDERAMFCFELITVCLYFLFTPQHCGRKTVRGRLRGLNSGKSAA